MIAEVMVAFATAAPVAPTALAVAAIAIEPPLLMSALASPLAVA
jgi:hypothetical protein